MRIAVVPSSYHFPDYNWRELRHLWSFWHTVHRVCAVAGGRRGSKEIEMVCFSSPFFTPLIAASAMVAGWDSAQHLQHKLPGTKPFTQTSSGTFTAMVPTQRQSDINKHFPCVLATSDHGAGKNLAPCGLFQELQHLLPT